MFKKPSLMKAAAIILIIAMMAALTACIGAPPPEKTVSNFFEAIKKSDIDAASKYLSTGSDDLSYDDKQQEKIVKLVLSKVDYKVLSVTKDKDKDKAIVKVTITSPDLVKATAEMLKELFAKLLTTALVDNKDKDSKNDKLIEESFEKCLNDPDIALVKTDAEIMLTYNKEKNAWVIETDDTLVNAITGNASAAFNNMSESNK